VKEKIGDATAPTGWPIRKRRSQGVFNRAELKEEGEWNSAGAYSKGGLKTEKKKSEWGLV